MKKYGLVGFPLTHSFSQKYFQQKFIDEGLQDCVFNNYQIEHIDEVKTMLEDRELKGFCITIPHKKNIFPYLDFATEAVKQMQACNCVKIKEGKLYGHNTDVAGFEHSFAPHLKPHHTKALILGGTGGAAAAVMFVLNKLHIAFKKVSRVKEADNFTYKELDKDILKAYTVIINATPLGTYPATDTAPDIPYEYLTTDHYLFDLVYNPPLTRFLSLGKANGAAIQNGYPMLTIQAEENWKIWNE